jgi:hypothetical protein
MRHRIRSLLPLLVYAPVLLLPLPTVWAAEAPAPSTVTGAAETVPSAAPGPQQAKKERKEPGCGKLLLQAMGIGAAAGLTVGLINGHDEVEATLLGAASPILVGLTLALLAASVPPPFLRPAESRPADLLLLGEPVRGRPGQILPRALGRAALGLAAGAGAGGRSRGQPIVQYTVRW